MTMKRIYNILKKYVLVAAVAFATLMTSCTDYLTIIPPDKIVHENFWQTKDEVNGMMATSYLKLLSSDAISKAIVWGDLRADNLKFPANYDQDFKYICEANILDDNGYANWGIYYEAINYANLVIEYAPLVVGRDPDFEKEDLDPVLGEMYAMRALCHFYLVRAFRDIPMALVPAVNDAELPEYKQVHPLEALNYIMEDLNRAEPLVRPSGSLSTPAQNCGRITKNAVLAMKADVNLWLAAFAAYYEGESDLVKSGDIERYYSQCINNCDAVIASMNQLYNKDKTVKSNDKFCLIRNEGEGEELSKTKQSTAYDAIFGAKNSSESIFELQIEGSNAENGSPFGAIKNIYGKEGNYGKVVVPNSFLNKYESDDLRLYSYTTKTTTSSGSSSEDQDKKDIVVAKYTARTSPIEGTREYRKDNNYDANWIVYRKTDVMLMKAEALALKPSSGVDDFKKAFELVDSINRRSRENVTKIKKPLQEASYIMASAQCAQLVLDERARELAFEGKRWFDLVRLALREKSTKNIVFVADKLDSNTGVVKSKMSTIDGLFFPIYIDELRFNKNLKQNPAYKNQESSTEMIK